MTHYWKKALLRTFILVSAIVPAVSAGAQEKGRFAYRGFYGGMMLHSGYVRSGSFHVTGNSGTVQELKMSGMPSGIGGAVRFLFGEHLRIGSEGYVSKLTSGKYDSRIETGWGGLLADCVWQLRKCRVFAGGTAGGGSQTGTIILSPSGNDYRADEIVFRKYSFMALAPFAGVEISLTPKMDIVLKADWLLSLSRREDDFVSGPRLYLGFMFGHRKQ